jgi:hypothetical protein
MPKTHLIQFPAHSINDVITAAIADLQLHPALEACLHLLNEDLASAYFLVRHMGGPLVVEGDASSQDNSPSGGRFGECEGVVK